MDELLMLHGVTRWCPDCDAETIFVPTPDEGNRADGCLCCTSCDAALYVGVAA